METTTATAATSSSKFNFTAISFLVGVLLFLLPFVDIKCNGQTLASNTGIGLAFGTDYKTQGSIKSMENDFGKNTEKQTTQKQNGKMYVVALIALALGVTGFIVSLLNVKPFSLALVIASLSALCLLVLMIQLQMDIKSQSTTNDMDVNLKDNIKVTAEFTAWYYLSIISFIAAAFFSYRRKQRVIMI